MTSSLAYIIRKKNCPQIIKSHDFANSLLPKSFIVIIWLIRVILRPPIDDIIYDKPLMLRTQLMI